MRVARLATTSWDQPGETTDPDASGDTDTKEWPGVRSASHGQEGVADMPPGKGARKVFTVGTDPKGGWRGEARGSTRAVAKGENKAEVVKRTIEVAKKQPKAQVRIKGKNGRIQEERTYPRSSDPKRTPG